MLGALHWISQTRIRCFLDHAVLHPGQASHRPFHGGIAPALFSRGTPDATLLPTRRSNCGHGLSPHRRQWSSQPYFHRSARLDVLHHSRGPPVLGRVAAGIAHKIRNSIAAMRLKEENTLADDDRRRLALKMVLGPDRLAGHAAA